MPPVDISHRDFNVCKRLVFYKNELKLSVDKQRK